MKIEDRGKNIHIYETREGSFIWTYGAHVSSLRRIMATAFSVEVRGEKIKQLTKLPTHLQGRGQQLYKHTRKEARREEGRRKGTKEGNACKRLTSLSTSKHNSRGNA